MTESDRSTRINRTTGEIVDAAMKVHTALGPGLLEGAYQACLAYELRKRAIQVGVSVKLPVVYERVRIDIGYRVDLIVNDTVLVELKAVAKLLPIHTAQLLSYLKLGDFRVGLLINFHVLRLRDGIERLVNEL